jgi:hypothetical protein
MAILKFDRTFSKIDYLFKSIVSSEEIEDFETIMKYIKYHFSDMLSIKGESCFFLEAITLPSLESKEELLFKKVKETLTFLKHLKSRSIVFLK